MAIFALAVPLAGTRTVRRGAVRSFPSPSTAPITFTTASSPLSFANSYSMESSFRRTDVRTVTSFTYTAGWERSVTSSQMP